MTPPKQWDCEKMFHQSNGEVVGIITDNDGFKHEISHCKYCGEKMSKPIPASKDSSDG